MNRFELKDPEKLEDMQKLTGRMVIVFGFFLEFCERNNLPVVITNILEKFPQSKSNTHPEGRALDISVKGWTEKSVRECIKHMNLVCRDYGAISKSSKEPRVIYYHDIGLGRHFHLQVRRG